jgi:hypothetical protein
MRRAGLLIAVLAGVAGPASAQGVLPRAAAFVAAVQANGCAMTEAEAEALLPPAGLTMEDARDAAAVMNRGRLFTVDDDGETLRLVPELCTAAPEGVALLLAQAAAAPAPGVEVLTLADRVDPPRAAAFVQVVRLNACAMSEAEAEVSLPPLGFGREQVQDIAAILFSSWMAEIDGDTLRLTEAACASDPATDAAWIEIVLSQERLMEVAPQDPADPAILRALAMMWTAGAGCTLDPADAAGPTELALGAFEMFDAPEADRAALAAAMAAVVADPGPAWRHDPDLPAGHLRLAYCPG